MAFLRNINAPASAPGGYAWDSPGDVVEVDDDLANDLLSIYSAGFVEVLPGADDYPAAPAPASRGPKPRPATKTPISE